ncbi:ureidoglycolate lyase [Sphingobacterium sp. ML3W]|uniref:fumarylacetoacetate hydrolase family protein n=1 Tax=Sphingobacterium sp. ML3W TaxID=1538644 RepID=UPI0004F60D1F|nr:fumarylacetoacetate hydrolase family protein [Sphingobacterium sp. ML3W]AIM36607.1 ureidoglycolate lyase [Sphingobacterium sp. ML3W]
MKLFRYGPLDQEKTGILINNIHYDTSGFGEDYDNDFLANSGLERLQDYINKNLKNLNQIPADSRIGTPIANPRKIVCVGLNYSDHATETGLNQEQEPILFLKAISALNGPFDDIIIPKNSYHTDWETELAIVIGKKGNHFPIEESSDYIAGYVMMNDVTERHFMKNRGGTWDKGKGYNTFAPLGPYFVTKDEIEDDGNLRIWLKLNGELMQEGNTKNFITPVKDLLSYISDFFGLFPGDIISTGSPAGTGIGHIPQRFLVDGDVIEYGIDGLGIAKNTFVDYRNT